MRFNTAGGANVISSKSENRQEKTALLCLDIDGPVLRGFPVFLDVETIKISGEWHNIRGLFMDKIDFQFLVIVVTYSVIDIC